MMPQTGKPVTDAQPNAASSSTAGGGSATGGAGQARPAADVTVQPVPLLKDNYAWLIRSAASPGVVVVDPGEAQPLEKRLGHTPVIAILLTHLHSDHIQGAPALAAHYHAPVYGPANTHPTHVLKGGETLDLQGLTVEVLDTPGHASGHLSYYVPAVPAVMTGDTLFSGGCGRLFDGTAEDLFHSFRKYDQLPPQTLVCPGHEYTAANLDFIAGLAEQGNPGVSGLSAARLHDRREEVRALRAQNQPSVPVSLVVEQATNPFLRARTPTQLAALRSAKDRA
ncbi:hydroxyacylglutathione hydrolase [Oecophyllibacter saccharovorans]|uniref:hydroxyacylglutathione hydrolase n=1 Tax=Oecophyllibacter saccharovorans TaxID=2558360 RepID=UPI0030C870FF